MTSDPGGTIIVLAMHGAPPNDFPELEAAEMFGLHGRLERTSGPERAGLEQRYRELEAKMRSWPRTAENDAFHAGSLQLAARLQEVTGTDVVLGFNEFCAPSLDGALDQAALRRPVRVIVVTPMMTRGGEHAEADIPEAIRRAGSRHPEVTMVYAWPYDDRDVARFLADQIARFTHA